ncbi:MAG: hypothetical protein Q4B50_05315 [Bacillota bacterium]|nr:hypothetical protein [Bacillota bacterium]
MTEIILNNAVNTISSSSANAGSSGNSNLSIQLPISFSHALDLDQLRLRYHRVRLGNAGSGQSSLNCTGARNSNSLHLQHDLLLELPLQLRSSSGESSENSEDTLLFLDNTGRSYVCGQPLVISSRMNSRY